MEYPSSKELAGSVSNITNSWNYVSNVFWFLWYSS